MVGLSFTGESSKGRVRDTRGAWVTVVMNRARQEEGSVPSRRQMIQEVDEQQGGMPQGIAGL